VDRRHTQAAYFVTEVHYEGGLRPVYEAYLYRPAITLLLLLSKQVQRLQSGSLRLYLSYIFATLIAVLLLTR
ncbi:MAG: oxidoreductase, partial [Chloroflexota bacterium]